MVHMPTLKQAEQYRFELMLYKVLNKIENEYFRDKIPEHITFELNIIGSLFNQTQTEICKNELKRRIDKYQARYFTPDDWVDHKALMYLENGLETDIRDNTLNLQTLCILNLETPDVIEAIGSILFKFKNIKFPTKINELIGYYRGNYYHKHITKQDCSNKSYSELLDYHFKSLKYGHVETAKMLFTLFEPELMPLLCINYLNTIKYLPNYITRGSDLNGFSFNEIDSLISYLKYTLISIVLSYDIDKLNRDKNEIIKFLSLEDYKSTLSYIMYKMFRDAPDYDCMKELKMFHHLIEDDDFYEYMLDHTAIFQHNPLCFRLMIVRSSRRQNRKIELKRMWDNYFNDFNSDSNFNFNNVMIIRDICIASYGKFDYHQVNSALCPFAFDMDTFHRQRLLIRLRKLNILARRHKIVLDFKNLLCDMFQIHHENVCRWIMKIMLKEKMEINFCTVLSCYLERIIKNLSIDIDWFISFVKPFREIFFSSIPEFLNILFRGLEPFHSTKIDTSIIIKILIWLDDEINYNHIFQYLTDVPYPPLGTYHEERNLAILKWIESERLKTRLEKLSFFRSILKGNLFKGDMFDSWIRESVLEISNNNDDSDTDEASSSSSGDF